MKEKRTVPNTSEENPLIMLAAAMGESMAGRDPSNAILEQEKGGQCDLVNSTQIPIPRQKDREALETMGVVFHDQEDLFVHVDLPEGWKKVATDHSMWSNLLDDKGRCRASMFYKAAFYDRDASISLNRRLTTARDYSDEAMDANISRCFVKDGETIIFTSKDYETDKKDKSEEARLKYMNENWDYLCSIECEEWLDEHYPDWEDASAYWDKEEIKIA